MATAAATLTHGFLFADLRGYTSFLEREGAQAAAHLLARYRALVRSAVERHSGAEIRTEGDSFYVVFPSASAAVACAMDIVAGAHADTSDAPAILVGIGVHAGESIATPEGPVGTAVNIAARLCALAAPGEVLVSDTVRALTRSVGAATYVPVGRRRLKGLADAIFVYRATTGAGTPAPRRPVPVRPLVLSAGAVILALAALASLRPGLTGTGARPSDTSHVDRSPGASASISADPPGAAPSATRRPGHFRSLDFAVPFTINLGRGWTRVGDEPDVAAFAHRDVPIGWVDVVLVAAVVDPPCDDAEPQFIGGRPEDLVEWITTRDWLEHGAPRPYNVGPYIGRAVDIEVKEIPESVCGERVEDLTFFRLGAPESAAFGATWGAAVGERKRVIALDVDGRTVTVVTGSPFEDVEQFWLLADPLLQSLRFTPTEP